MNLIDILASLDDDEKITFSHHDAGTLIKVSKGIMYHQDLMLQISRQEMQDATVDILAWTINNMLTRLRA